MKKKILITGCSHVSGQGFHDAENGKEHSQYAWPAMAEQDFEIEVINLSKPGASSSHCIEGVQNYPNKQSLSGIMVMLPHSVRTLQQINVRGVLEDDFWHPGYISKNDRWDKIIGAYQKVCHNPRTNNINLLAYAGYLNFISTTYNIPLWLTATTDTDYDLLIENKFRLRSSTDWMRYCQEKNFPRLPDGHYGHKAHTTFYAEFVKPWLNIII